MSTPFYEAEHEEFRDSVAKFFARTLSGAVAEQRQSGFVASADVTLAAEQGLLGINVPESCGGSGVADLRFQMVIVEEAMRIGALGYALTMALQSVVVVPQLIADERLAGRTELLTGIAAGSRIVAVAGAHQPIPAVVEGDSVILTGVAKSAVAGVIASHVLVGCVTETGDHLVVLTDVGDAGLRVARARKLLGGNDAGVTNLVFDQLTVPPGRVLRSAAALEAVASDVELLLAAVAVSGAGAALAWTTEYAATRQVFGQPLSTFENTRHVVSGLTADLGMAQGSLRNALTVRGQHAPAAPSNAELAVTATRLYSRAADDGLQLHGGYGYMHEYPIAQAYADAEFLRLLVDRFDIALRCERAVTVSL
ncbi:acyl-CoA dehydrogenase family protein [Mycolicibacterium hodleri]|nr:acyl-CoA dehydrogenase family protein [Mycolicibacterium hodleri]